MCILQVKNAPPSFLDDVHTNNHGCDIPALGYWSP
jgi:hypothetical protein